MGFQSTVLKIFIASPGDTLEERNQVERIIHEWNDLNSEREKVVLLPIRWERSISPEYSLSEDGQELINKRILMNSDIVIMILKSKIGSPTSRTESGTLEELEVFSKEHADKIGIFFCNIPAPTSTLGLTEYQKVVLFREKLEIETRGIYGSYEQKQVENFLTRQVAKYTTKLEIERKNSNYKNVEKDNSSIIIDYIQRDTLPPDELLLLKFMYTEGYNTIDINASFKYDIYASFLKENGYKDKYINLLEHTSNRLFDRKILELLGMQQSFNPYNHEVEDSPRYKLNIKTYDELGNILEEYKTHITELLGMCKIEDYENDLPF